MNQVLKSGDPLGWRFHPPGARCKGQSNQAGVMRGKQLVPYLVSHLLQEEGSHITDEMGGTEAKRTRGSPLAHAWWKLTLIQGSEHQNL